MTAGRFTRVERPRDDDDGPLLVHRVDDEILEPHQLSTGTREQLYLAVRLAYVLHYCGRTEALPIVMDDVLANFDDDRAAHPPRTRRRFQARSGDPVHMPSPSGGSRPRGLPEPPPAVDPRPRASRRRARGSRAQPARPAKTRQRPLLGAVAVGVAKFAGWVDAARSPGDIFCHRLSRR